MTSLPLLGFWAIAQPKRKILAWNFGHLLITHSSMICIYGFWIYVKKRLLKHLFFWKIDIVIFWVKSQKNSWQIQGSRFVDCVIWHLLVFVSCGLLKNPTFQKHLNAGRFFYPKSRGVTSLKRHFLKNVTTDFAEIVFEDVKLMLNTVKYKFSFDTCPRF